NACFHLVQTPWTLMRPSDDHSQVHNNQSEYQLPLRAISGLGQKVDDTLFEAEATHYKRCPIKVTLATVKMSVPPTGSLRDFEMMWP
ncbi:LOW QUALITY PROTEIN: hypothetical protein U0070_004848, partial [Myodes glareolus]